VIGLRAEHQIHLRRPPKNLRAFGLRDTARNRDHHVLARRGLVVLEPAQTAQLGEHLLGRLFANVTGIEDDHVGAPRAVHRGIAERCQDVRHTRGVVDVHLTTVGFDEKLFRQNRVTRSRCETGALALADRTLPGQPALATARSLPSPVFARQSQPVALSVATLT
jgi:hypothetical protein